MDIGRFIKWLNKAKGLHIDAAYYTYVTEWRDWWRGYSENFHNIKERDARGTAVTRPMHTLHMAQRICEDWAALLCNEKTTLTISDKQTAGWLTGNDDQTGGELQRTNFWMIANKLVELAMRSGTGAFKLSVEDMAVQSGQIVPSAEAKLFVDCLPAECILPLTVKRGKITECAFASEVQVDGRSCVYLETHELVTVDGVKQYRISNEYFVSNSSGETDGAAYQPAPLPDGMLKSFLTGSDLPWFAIFTPAAAKTLEGGMGLGMAVFANAVDQLKHVDLAFHNYVMDIQLGGKKVFYDRSLMLPVYNKDGTTTYIPPDDIRQQMFFQLPNSEAETPDWHEYNPSLRTEENSRAVQDALDYLSFRCGLGTHHYQFGGGGVTTATEYMGNRQDMIQNANRQQIQLETALIQLFKSYLWIAKNICAAPVNPDCDISVNFDDRYFDSMESRREIMRQDVLEGILPKWRYLMEWYGMDEETAKQTASETQPTGQRLQFGGE